MQGNVLKELLGLRKKILLMPISIERDYLLLDFIHLYKYLENLNYHLDEDLIDFDNIERLNKITTTSEMYQMIEYVINNDFLNKNIDEILNVYKDNNFYAVNNFGKRINVKNMGIILNNFFKCLDEEVFDIYKNLLEEDKVGFSEPSDSSGLTFHRMFENLSNVVMCNYGDCLIDYCTFAHEVGHVYQFYLQRNMPYLSNLHYGTEITSRVFEKLFHKYLLDNMIYPDQTINTLKMYHYQNINLYAHCKLICELISKNECLFDKTIIKTNMTREEIKNKLENDCGFVYENIMDLDYSNILYIIGDIISSNLYEEISKDKKEGLIKLKNFITSFNNLNMIEAFNIYGNINKAKDYINNDLNKIKKLS